MRFGENILIAIEGVHRSVSKRIWSGNTLYTAVLLTELNKFLLYKLSFYEEILALQLPVDANKKV